jgi:phosphopantetheinyl transferase (holo-ACP synthase)
LEKYGDRFARRRLNEDDQLNARSTRPALFLAKRFAAKEAYQHLARYPPPVS